MKVYPNKLLDLAARIREMTAYLERFGTTDPNGMWAEPGFYPREAALDFVSWMNENWDIDEQVGILMILRRCKIAHPVFIREAEPQTVEWFEKIRGALAREMGGRMGRIHSGRRSSKYPVE